MSCFVGGGTEDATTSNNRAQQWIQVLIPENRRAGSGASSSASTSRSATPPPSPPPPPPPPKRAKRNETAVRSDGQEAPITKVKTSCETVVKADEPEEEDFEDNPYDLKDDAQKWLEEDMKPFGAEGYLVPKPCYHPCQIDSKSSIFDEKLKKTIQEQLEKAGAEYEKRVKKADAAKIKKPIQPVLVFFGVSKKMMGMLNDHDALGFGQFLYFPTLGQGALFMTYMPGPEHGEPDTEFAYQACNWRNTNGLFSHLGVAANTGGHHKPQPDLRIYPRKSNKDSHGNDQDQSNRKLPHSRFYWEIEYKHRNIINLRKHGEELMSRTEYTRLFGGCKFVGPTADNSTTFEAAIVLWGKNDANEIEVLKAIDFGSREFVKESKDDWSSDLVSMLPPVPKKMWNRPADAGNCPWQSSDDLENPDSEWVLNIPIKSLLYKVTAYESDEYLISPSTQRGGRYYLNDRELKDMHINLMKIAHLIAVVVEDSAGN